MSAVFLSLSTLLRSFIAQVRVVGSYRLAKGNGQPVPAVDCDDGHRQLDQLFFTELCTDCSELFVRRMRLRDERDGFCPPQRRTLAVSIEGSFAPSVEGVEALLALAERPCILGVHIKAVRAAVHL